MDKAAAHPLRIFVVRIGAMGDVFHAMPAVAGLRAALPECQIGWAIEPRWAPLLVSSAGEMPLVDRVHLVPTREWKKRPWAFETVREVYRLAQELRREHYDVVVDLQGSIKSAVIGRLAGARTFAGPDAPRELPARLLYTYRVSTSRASVIEQAVELVAASASAWLEEGDLGTLEGAAVRLPRDQAAEAWTDSVLQERCGLLAAGRPVLLVPQAGWGAKEWGAANYAELALQLRSAGLCVLINKAPGSSVADEIASSSGTLAVGSSLPQMVALVRRCGLVVGGDTGPVHLTAALGIPLVALFGPTDPERTGPWFPGAPRVQVLRDPSSVTDHRRHRETEAGLKRIRVEEVLDVALAMLNDSNRG